MLLERDQIILLISVRTVNVAIDCIFIKMNVSTRFRIIISVNTVLQKYETLLMQYQPLKN